MVYLCKVIGKLFIFSFSLFIFYLLLSNLVYAESNIFVSWKNSLFHRSLEKKISIEGPADKHYSSFWTDIKSLLSKNSNRTTSPKFYRINNAECGNNVLDEGEVCDGSKGVKASEICSNNCGRIFPIKDSGKIYEVENEFSEDVTLSEPLYAVDYAETTFAANEERYDLGRLPSGFSCLSWPILPTITNEISVSDADKFNQAASQPWTRIRVEKSLTGDCTISASDVEIIVEDEVQIESLFINHGVQRIKINGGSFNEINIKAPVSFWPDYKVKHDWVVEDIVIENVTVQTSTYYGLFGMARRLAILNSKILSKSSTFTSESPEGLMGENYIIAGNEFYSQGSLQNISISRTNNLVFIDNIVFSSNAFNQVNLTTDADSANFYIARNQFVGTGISLANKMSWIEENTFYHKRGVLLDLKNNDSSVWVTENSVYSDLTDCLVCGPAPAAWNISQSKIYPYKESAIEEKTNFISEPEVAPESELPAVATSPVSKGVAQDEVTPFFIGHSLLNAHVPKMIDEIAGSLGKNNTDGFDENYLTGVGASLSWNYNHPYDGEGADPFTELSQPNKYNALVLTDAIPVVLFEEETKEFALRFFQLALKGNPNTDLFLFSTWVHKDGLNFSEWSAAIEEETAVWERVRAYLVAETGRRNIYIIPGGYAVRQLVEKADARQVSGLINGDALFKDDSIHLNALGDYFISLVHFACLYRDNPRGATRTTFSPPGKENRPLPNQDLAEKMQTIAWQTVLDYPFSGVKALENDGVQEIPASDPLCGNNLTENVPACDDANRRDGDGRASNHPSAQMDEHLRSDSGRADDQETETTSSKENQSDGTREFSTDRTVREPERTSLSGCGNAQRNGQETCDDGNASDGDGCSSICQVENASSSSHRIGLNLSWNFNQIQQWMFVDAMKHASPWATRAAKGWQGWNTETQDEISWRPDGYPVEIPALTSRGPQVVYTIMLSNHELSDSTWPAGDYTVFYEGDGELAFGGDAVLVGHSPGQYIVNVQPRLYVELQIRRSNPDNPIRNIQMIMPGFKQYYSTNPFHPLFLERLGNVAALKFTRAAATNVDSNGSWNRRVTPNYFSQGTEKGVALEYFVQLANITHKAPWFNIPHSAEDEYVRRYAEYIRDHLDPSLAVYVEYSNEVWNNAFIQSEWLREKGCRDPETFVSSAGSNDTGIAGCDDFTAGVKATAKRMATVFEIFDQVFGGHSQRVIKIIGGHTQWYQYNDWLWDFFNDPGINPKGIAADAFAIAPYFARSQNLSEVLRDQGEQSLTVNRILDFAADELQTTVNGLLRHYRHWTRARNLRLLAYEGGNLLTHTENGPAMAQKLETASRHPRMGAFYREYFNQWQKAGGDLMMVCSYIGLPGFGTTRGLLEYQDQPLNEAYMYQAVMAAGGDDNSVAVCGDGVTKEWETCDDGNTTDGDGCSKYCVMEQVY